MFFILNKLISSFVCKTIVIVWLSLRLKMSCFSHQGFLGGGGEGVVNPRLWVAQYLHEL